MYDEKNRFPHDFKRWHDIRIDEYATKKAMEDEEKRKELYAKFACIAEKYLPLQYTKRSAFICIIAKSPASSLRFLRKIPPCHRRPQIRDTAQTAAFPYADNTALLLTRHIPSIRPYRNF